MHLNLNHFFCAQKSRFFREQKSQSSMRTSCTTLPGRAASTQAHEGRNQWFQQRPRITDHGQAHEGRNWWFQQRPRIKDHGAAWVKNFDRGIGDRRDCQKIAPPSPARAGSSRGGGFGQGVRSNFRPSKSSFLRISKFFHFFALCPCYTIKTLQLGDK